MRARWPLLIFLLDVPSVQAQTKLVYYDFIDSAKAATTARHFSEARTFYQKAFDRRPALAQHAIAAARICWLLKDRSCTDAYVKNALDLGWTGDELATDSVLGTYWPLGVVGSNGMLWQQYEAMILPDLKAELEAMFKEDQDIRKNVDWEKADSPDTTIRRATWRPVEALDKKHTDRVVQIIREHGVPSVHQVGRNGNKAIFFAFIHAQERDTLYAYAPLLSASVKRGDSPPTWYAFIIDRIMVHTSKETMFGTTGYLDPADSTYYFTTVVPSQTELLREQMGLPRSGRNPD